MFLSKAKGICRAVLGKLWQYGTYPIRSCVAAELNKTELAINKRVSTLLAQHTTGVQNSLVPFLNQLNSRVPYVAYRPGEKIRVAIFFQSPTTWPAFEGVWDIMRSDARLEVKVLLYDGPAKEVAHVYGSREFLTQSGIPFDDIMEYDFTRFNPHILFYQTPWEATQRPRALHSDIMRQYGYRIAYVPYGIEYAWAEQETQGFYNFSNFRFKAALWRMYALSERMVLDHLTKSPLGAHNIIPTGLPRFDGIARNERHPLSETLRSAINGRKLVLMCMHFPHCGNGSLAPIPDLAEYLAFLSRLHEYPDIFFLIRPHPNFYHYYEDLGRASDIKRFKALINKASNAHLDTSFDYRPATSNADYLISDRSALLVETSAWGIPILYMTNVFYTERMLPAVKPLFDACYQGNTCYDIQHFIDMVIQRGIDYKKEERNAAKALCLPYMDGQCARRIVDDLVSSLEEEKQAE